MKKYLKTKYTPIEITLILEKINLFMVFNVFFGVLLKINRKRTSDYQMSFCILKVRFKLGKTH